MKWIWEVLQIEPTGDERTIKRAYASLAGIYNPEEHPQEFLRIREAYEAALAWAREGGTEDAAGGLRDEAKPGTGSANGNKGNSRGAGNPDDGREDSRETGSADRDRERGQRTGSADSDGERGQRTGSTDGDGEKDSSSYGSSPGFNWDFTEENPFREGEGIKHFRELYVGKRRKDRNAWSEYFHSEDFLEGYREKAFAELLLETVEENLSVCPPGQEFLTELYITYGLRGYKTGDGVRFEPDPNGVFDGIGAILKIAGKGPVITRFKGNDPAMMAGFRDYRELLLLSLGSWDDRDMLRLGKIIDGYLPHHVSDRPIRDSGQYELSQRHPRSLKLIAYFFASRKLPAKVCRVPWNHLHLENATLGREKLWYGGLREAVAAQVPELLEKPRVNYMQLMQEIGTMTFYGNDGETEQERDSLDRLFEREDFLFALGDEVFVEEQILHYWIGKKSGKYLIQKLQEYYGSHREAPFAGPILEQIAQTRKYQKIQEEFLEDMQAPLSRGIFDLHDRSWLRYYLNVAFHLAQGENWLLPDYLKRYMPYSPEWGKRLVDPTEGGFDEEHLIGLQFGENVLYIRFHPRHIEYLWGEEQSPLVPPFPGQELEKIADDGMFWLLVPIAAAGFEAWQGIYEELSRRLYLLPVEQEHIPVIADCITGRICRFAQDNVPVCTFYREKEEEERIRLFGCDVYGNGALVLYEEMENQQILLPGGTGGMYSAPSVENAVQMGQRMLQELGADRALELYMELLPERISVRGRYSSSSALEGEQVTEEAVKEQFEKYFGDQTNRLELVWEQRSLLFVKEKQQYACFYFDHRGQSWYALVSMPEVYAVVESDQVLYVRFGLGMLPDYLVHRNLNLIRSRLGDILRQIACHNPCPRSMMWSPQVYRFEIRQRYRLALRQFGGYSAEQARNQLLDRFYIPQLPVSLIYTDMEGQETEKNLGERDKAAVQEALADYVSGRLDRLILIWQYEWQYETADRAGETVKHNRVLCLLRDRDMHMMAYRDDRTEGVEYLVADVKEYMEAEGRKVRKVVFRGRTVPGCLVHTDLIRIRDGLDLLIPQMGQQAVCTGQFGEFSYEKAEII